MWVLLPLVPATGVLGGCHGFFNDCGRCLQRFLGLLWMALLLVPATGVLGGCHGFLYVPVLVLKIAEVIYVWVFYMYAKGLSPATRIFLPPVELNMNTFAKFRKRRSTSMIMTMTLAMTIDHDHRP